MVRAAVMRGGRDVPPPERPPFIGALIAGGVIGFVSGTTGTGGGIFLAPVILSMNWVSMRRTAAVTAAYNLLNSGAALIGAFRILGDAPPALPLWIAIVGVGGMIGAYMGSHRLPESTLRCILATILSAAGAKLLLS